MAKKINRNPAIAYQQGKTDGCFDGFLASNRLLLLAMYNTIDDFIENEEKHGEFAQAIEDEMNRLFQNEFHEDVQLIETAMHHTYEIRKRWGMKVYD